MGNNYGDNYENYYTSVANDESEMLETITSAGKLYTGVCIVSTMVRTISSTLKNFQISLEKESKVLIAELRVGGGGGL